MRHGTGKARFGFAIRIQRRSIVIGIHEPTAADRSCRRVSRRLGRRRQRDCQVARRDPAVGKNDLGDAASRLRVGGLEPEAFDDRQTLTVDDHIEVQASPQEGRLGQRDAFENKCVPAESIADDRIPAGTPDDDRIVTQLAIDDIGSFGRDQTIVGIASIEAIVAGAAVQSVGAAVALELIVAIQVPGFRRCRRVR